MTNRRLLLTLLMFGAAMGPAGAQTWPDRPINLVIQFAPGTTTDIVARHYAQLLSQELGTPVVPVNRPGASGTIGVGEVARAAPDGYTIGMANLPALTVIPHIQPVSFDPLNDLHHVGVIGPYEYGIYVATNAPWKTWEELVAYARANPRTVTYGTPGTGTTNHLIMERIGKDLGIDWQHIPFKGDSEIIPNLLGGHLSMGVGSPGAIVPQVKGGKVRLLLVTSRDPWRDLPDVPTIQSKGLNYFQASFLSVVAPARIPGPVKARLDAATRKIFTDPAVIAEFRDKYSTTVAYESGDAFGRFVRDQYEFNRSFLKTVKLN